MKRVLEWYYIILITAMILASQNLVVFPTGITEILVLIYIILVSYKDNWILKIKINDLSHYVWKLWIVPNIIIWIYSIIIQVSGNYSSDYLVHTTTMFIRMVLYVLLAVSCTKIHGRKSVDILMISCIISYIPAIFKYFINQGLVQGFKILLFGNSYSQNIDLEVHTLTYIFGFLTIYYFYQFFVSREKCKSKFFYCLIFTLIGMKRIVTIAVVFTLLIIFILKLFKTKTRYKMVCIGSILMIVLAILYLALIKYGIFEYVLNMLGINTSFRFYFWNHFRTKYEIAPTFLGYGISYSHRIMQHEWQMIEYLREPVNIHNDILGYYLGLGFFGSIIYWWMFFYRRVKNAEKIAAIEAAVFSFAISFYYFVVMMTSNEGLSEFPYSIYFLMIYSVICYYRAEDKHKITKSNISKENTDDTIAINRT